MNYVIVAEGLSGLNLSDIPPKLTEAARQAINRTTEWARTQASREMREQVNFPARYLTGSDGRLRIAKKATNTNLEAAIVGRHRPTSLARFSKDTDPGVVKRRGGARVAVKPGAAKFMKGTFLVRLRAGATKTDTKHNLGLAIRLKPGESLRNKRTQGVRLANNVYLLYGPSVDQVFRDVSGEMTPDVINYLQQEFDRLRLVKGI